MGRPIGVPNREKRFGQALQVALHARPLALRRIADELLDRAEQGSLPHIIELINRLDGKPAQVIDRGDAPAHELSDAELYIIIEEAKRPKALLPPVSKCEK